jgi:CheY-like chemotaxis protein
MHPPFSRGQQERAQTLAAGSIGFLDKPFSDEELIACLNKALAANGV